MWAYAYWCRLPRWGCTFLLTSTESDVGSRILMQASASTDAGFLVGGILSFSVPFTFSLPIYVMVRAWTRHRQFPFGSHWQPYEYCVCVNTACDSFGRLGTDNLCMRVGEHGLRQFLKARDWQPGYYARVWTRLETVFEGSGLTTCVCVYRILRRPVPRTCFLPITRSDSPAELQLRYLKRSNKTKLSDESSVIR